MKYTFTNHCLRMMKKLPKQVQRRIISKLEYFSIQDNPLVFATPIVGNGPGSYRFRIGEYRVVFDVKEDWIIVTVVGHRREVYK